MLEMGFKEHLETIMNYIPRVQTLMFSATMTKGIVSLADMCASEPEKLLLQGVSAQKEENTGSEIGRAHV